MKEQYMDIPVNIRQRLDDVNGDEYCGFYVTEVTFKCDVTLETKLWDLARNIQGQLKTIIGQDQHLLFAKVTGVSVQGVESLWGDCRFIPADWGS